MLSPCLERKGMSDAGLQVEIRREGGERAELRKYLG